MNKNQEKNLRDYLYHDSNICPGCYTTHINFGKEITENGTIYVEMSCENGHKWTAAFDLDRVIQLEMNGRMIVEEYGKPDYADMMHSILEHKEVLPTLMGLNDSLDELIEQRLGK